MLNGRRPDGRPSVITVAIVLLIGAMAVGCGSRLSYDRLLADARGGTVTRSSGGPAGGSGGGIAGPQGASQSSDTGAGGGNSVSSGGGSTGASPSGGGSAGPVAGGGSGASGGAVAGTPQASGGSGPAGCSGAGTPIVIGTVGEQSGLIGGFIRTGPSAVQAWVASINSRGGVNCHRVKYIIVDDGGDPSRNQSLTQQLVEQDHVMAFVQMDAPIAGQAGVSYLTQKRVPVMGSETGSPWFYQSPMYFPQSSSGQLSLSSAIAGAATLGKAKGLTRMGSISCIEAPICSTMYTTGGATAAQFGASMAFRAQVSLAQPDFTSTCQAAQSAGAQVLVLAVDPNGISRFARSCSSVNYHPQLATGGPVVNSVLLTDTALDGIFVGSVVAPYSLTSNPAVAQYSTTLKQYAPGIVPDGAGMTGWVSAKLFELATQHLSEPPTSQSVLDGLWSIKDNDLGGMTQPLTFVKDQNTPVKFCFWSSQVRGGQLVPANGGQRTCA